MERRRAKLSPGTLLLIEANEAHQIMNVGGELLVPFSISAQNVVVSNYFGSKRRLPPPRRGATLSSGLPPSSSADRTPPPGSKLHAPCLVTRPGAATEEGEGGNLELGIPA